MSQFALPPPPLCLTSFMNGPQGRFINGVTQWGGREKEFCDTWWPGHGAYVNDRGEGGQKCNNFMTWQMNGPRPNCLPPPPLKQTVFILFYLFTKLFKFLMNPNRSHVQNTIGVPVRITVFVFLFSFKSEILSRFSIWSCSSLGLRSQNKEAETSDGAIGVYFRHFMYCNYYLCSDSNK